MAYGNGKVKMSAGGAMKKGKKKTAKKNGNGAAKAKVSKTASKMPPAMQKKMAEMKAKKKK